MVEPKLGQTARKQRPFTFLCSMFRRNFCNLVFTTSAVDAESPEQIIIWPLAKKLPYNFKTLRCRQLLGFCCLCNSDGRHGTLKQVCRQDFSLTFFGLVFLTDCQDGNLPLDYFFFYYNKMPTFSLLWSFLFECLKEKSLEDLWIR